MTTTVEGGAVDAEREGRIAVWRDLMAAHDTLMKQFQTELRSEFDLSLPQYDVLRRLSLAGEACVRMGEVADALLFSSGAATKVLDRLVDRGLVERGADPDDRRTVLVGLTDDGRALFARAQRTHGDSIQEKVGPFASADERRHVETFLKRLAAGGRA